MRNVLVFLLFFFSSFSSVSAQVLRDGTRFTIDRGTVVRQQDRNGNVVRYRYQPNSTLLSEIIDSLDRVTTLQRSPHRKR